MVADKHYSILHGPFEVFYWYYPGSPGVNVGPPEVCYPSTDDSWDIDKVVWNEDALEQLEEVPEPPPVTGEEVPPKFFKKWLTERNNESDLIEAALIHGEDEISRNDDGGMF